MVQNDKKFCLSCSIYLESYIIWLCFMVQMCKMIISPGVFFNFKIFILRVIRGLKGQKVAQNDKNSVCRTLYFKNHISYDLHLWYTCMYKSIISLGLFLIFFSKFWFLGSLEKGRGRKWAKNGPKWQKIMSVSLHTSGTVHHMIVIFGAHV